MQGGHLAVSSSGGEQGWRRFRKEGETESDKAFNKKLQYDQRILQPAITIDYKVHKA